MLQLHVIEPLIHKFFQEVSIGASDWIERCAIVRWFDENTLAKFVYVENPSAIIDDLSRLSFVEARDYGFALHDLVRSTISRELSDQSPGYYQKLHREAADYYFQLALNSPRGVAQRLIVEMVYHLMRVDEDEGIAHLKKVFDSAKAFSQLDLAAAFLETTEGLPLRDENRAWVEYSKNVLLQKSTMLN